MQQQVDIDQLNSIAPANKNVLIVDDDEPYAHLVSRHVRQIYSNAVIDNCNNSKKAIELCLARQYDILLIDHNLPDLCGSDFLHKLQSEIDDIPPPAIVLTADGGASAAGEALRANAYDFLPKQLVTRESLGRSMKNAIAKHSLQKSVHERTLELEIANRSLTEKSREIGEFYQTVSHEVKTPLAANREFVSLVRDEVLGSITEEQAEALDYALASCDQIASHFNDLVEMTRLDSGKIALHKTQIAVDSLLKRTMASCARAIDDSGVSVVMPTNPGDTELYVDGNRLVQVLSNLLSNAIKYTPSNGTIDISMNYQGSCVRFCVADTGLGIDEQHMDSVFNRLFQIGDTSHEYSGAGLGLGLSISREIVVLHEGAIWVESKLGIGSQFYVELPQQDKAA